MYYIAGTLQPSPAREPAKKKYLGLAKSKDEVKSWDVWLAKSKVGVYGWLSQSQK